MLQRDEKSGEKYTNQGENTPIRDKLLQFREKIHQSGRNYSNSGKNTTIREKLLQFNEKLHQSGRKYSNSGKKINFFLQNVDAHRQTCTTTLSLAHSHTDRHFV